VAHMACLLSVMARSWIGGGDPEGGGGRGRSVGAR
jgi:hypothetical protein